MVEKFLLYFIKLIHILFILFVVLVPFFGTNFLLIIHFITIPFVMLHWVLNQNVCFLTFLEKKLSKKENYECITCKIIEPIYDFKKNYKGYSTIIYGITTILWLITCYKLYSSYKELNIKFNMKGLEILLTH